MSKEVLSPLHELSILAMHVEARHLHFSSLVLGAQHRACSCIERDTWLLTIDVDTTVPTIFLRLRIFVSFESGNSRKPADVQSDCGI